MPKERVHAMRPGFDVQVGWQRNDCVQVAVVTSDGASLTKHVAQWRDDDGECHLTPDGAVVRSDGVWAYLDRHQINQLIRQLRKARDQAYGADA